MAREHGAQQQITLGHPQHNVHTLYPDFSSLLASWGSTLSSTRKRRDISIHGILPCFDNVVTQSELSLGHHKRCPEAILSAIHMN
jgi:hypothetical protein